MVRSGNLVRFTSSEVEAFRQIGLTLSNVRHQSDIEQEVSRWARTIADERFDLLEKIALEMARARGLRLTPKLGIASKQANPKQLPRASAAEDMHLPS